MAKPKKITVTVLRGVQPQQIEDFPEDCERSSKGSLHISPGTYELTEGELHHLRKHHKDVARRLTVLPPPRPKEKPADEDTAEVSVPEKAQEVEEQSDGEASEPSPRSKRSKSKSK